MTILDRYILKSFFFNLILWFFCIIGIYIVFDLFTNLESLVDIGKKMGSVPKTIIVYYLFKSIPIGMMLCSLLGLVSAMITIAMMMRHNELIPIQAAGISTIRIITPLIVAVVFVAATATVFREAVLPNYVDELVMEVEDMVEDQGIVANATIDNVTGITLQGERIFKKESRISDPNFVLHRPLVKKTTYVKAKNAFYHSAKNGRPAGFLFVDLKEPSGITKETGLTLENEPVLITHQDAPDWIEANQCFIASNVPFDYLASNDAWRQYASTFDLVKAVRNNSLDVGNRIRAVIHSRVLQPFLDIILLFLGLPVILGNGDRNVFKAMGISGLIVFSFLIVQKSCEYLGANNGMPVLGAWLPLMVFFPIALNQFLMLRER